MALDDKLKKIYTDCQEANRLFYNNLYEAFINRNAYEIKEISNLAIEKNVGLIARYLSLPTPTNSIKSLFGLLMSAEALERAFSNVDIKLDKVIDDEISEITDFIKSLSGTTDERHREMKEKLRSVKESLQKAVDEQAKEEARLKHHLKKAGAQTPDITMLKRQDLRNNTVRAICKYYLIFRAIRELLSTFHARERKDQIEERSAILTRALGYVEMAQRMDPRKIESFLVKAMIHRERGVFDGKVEDLWSAWDTLVEAYNKIDHTLLDVLQDAETHRFGEDGDRVAQCVDMALFKPRIINDIARVYEALAKVKSPDPGGPSHVSQSFRKKLSYSEFDWTIVELLKKDQQSLFQKSSVADKTYCGHALALLKELEELDSHEKSYIEIFDSDVGNELNVHTGSGFKHPACHRALQQLKTNPRAHVYLHNIGRLYVRLGDDTHAIKYYKDALEANPDYTAAHENLALLLMAKGDCPTADRHLSVARRVYGEKNNPRQLELPPNMADVILAERDQKRLLKKYLVQEPTLDVDKHDHLAILRRWNSYTPSIPTKPKSLGGGYFMSISGQGVVIDPGFDFLRNFAEAGYSLNDIKCVVVTHLHTDHIKDLEDMLFLFYEQFKRTGLTANKPVYVCAMPRVLKSLAHRLCAFLDSSRPGASPIFDGIRFIKLSTWDNVDELSAHEPNLPVYKLNEKSKDPLEECPDEKFGLRDLEIKTTPTYHFGKAVHNRPEADEISCGLLIKLPKHGVVIGLTSDTCWREELVEPYLECDFLIGHLGELYCNDIDKAGEISTNLDLSDRRHLGLYGLHRLIGGLGEEKLKLVVVSEFGEELGVYRNSVAKSLNDRLFLDQQSTLCFTGDLNLRVGLTGEAWKFDVRCEMCGSYFYRPFHELREMAVGLTDGDSRIVHYCFRHNEEIVKEKLSKVTSKGRI